MKTFLAPILFLFTTISSQAQTESTWYDYLNERLTSSDIYLINGSDFLNEYKFEYRAFDIESFEPRYHRPKIYYKPNNKKLLLWDDTNEKISSLEFDDIDEYPYNSIVVKIGDSYGVLDTTGLFIIPPKYNEVRMIDECNQDCESQLFYLEEHSSSSETAPWHIVDRKSRVIYSSEMAHNNSSKPRFTDINFIYFNNRVHYLIETLSGNDYFFTVGVMGEGPLYTKSGKIEFISSSYRNNSYETTFETTKYKNSGFNHEYGYLNELELAVVTLNNPQSNSVVHNDKLFFDFKTSKFLTEFGGFSSFRALDNRNSVETFENANDSKWLKLQKCSHNDGTILPTYDAKKCNDLYGLFDIKLNMIIPFGNRNIEIIDVPELKDFFISTVNNKKGLINKNLGIILESKYSEINPISSSITGKYWEVELESGFKKVYNTVAKTFLYDGMEFDDLRWDNGICFGLLDGKEYPIFTESEKDPSIMTLW